MSTQPLTRREVQVAGLVAEGLIISDQESARRLHVSKGTAKAHVASARRKLDAPVGPASRG